jgi:uncharacterized protein YukE
MGGFSEQSVNSNGGVAWAKQVAENMDPSAIDAQIQSYQQAAGQLQKVQTTLQNVKNNLAASWTGDASTQAQTSFQASIDHSVQTQETINQTVIPPLQNAKSAQVEFVNTMQGIQSEKTVPSNSISDEASNFFFGTPLPSQVAEAHNTAVRTETANALNKLSTSYDQSASEMTKGVNGGSTGPEGSGPSYSTGTISGTSGDGLAGAYGETVGGGATTKAGYVPAPEGPHPGATIGDPSPTPTPTPTPDPFGGPPGGPAPVTDPFPVEPTPDPAPVGGGAGLITDEPTGGGGTGEGEGVLGDGLGEDGGGGFGSGSGVFGENGFSDGQLTGGTGTGAKVGSMSGSDGDGAGESSGGAVIGGDGESPESMGAMGGRGGMGGGGSDEELASSSTYSRGRYFDGDPDEDQRPSVSSVRSAFEDATDGDGNKVNMMGGRRGSARDEDEEEERGKRPAYLKEDEFWNNAQRIVPPVIQ